MKLAILSESPADEAALRVLVEYVLGGPFTTVQSSLRARGWPSVEQVLPPIIRHLHFNTDADGLVVVVDSDDSPVHTPEHEAPGYYHPFCRVCRLRAVFRRTIKHLPPAAAATACCAVGRAVRCRRWRPGCCAGATPRSPSRPGSTARLRTARPTRGGSSSGKSMALSGRRCSTN